MKEDFMKIQQKLTNVRPILIDFVHNTILRDGIATAAPRGIGTT